jgi:hypothetical protein
MSKTSFCLGYALLSFKKFSIQDHSSNIPTNDSLVYDKDVMLYVEVPLTPEVPAYLSNKISLFLYYETDNTELCIWIVL